ncbi:MAG: GtrA family protein [Bacteroidales bacterium]|nr:GtrA family protein [Bacteroidales bacterium]MBR1950314.1 GtrA family protein [Bacteroidales bacterium]MBR4087869.1 GtrA family protein [Bacteroidales bacterium]
MKLNPVIWEFVRFGLVGGFCTALHYGIYFLLQLAIEVNVAYTVGYLLSFIANFYLTSYFTFGTAPSWRKLFGMAGAHGVNYLLHMVLLNLFIWIGVRQEFAPLPVFAIAIPVNFILVRFVFKHKTENYE